MKFANKPPGLNTGAVQVTQANAKGTPICWLALALIHAVKPFFDPNGTGIGQHSASETEIRTYQVSHAATLSSMWHHVSRTSALIFAGLCTAVSTTLPLNTVLTWVYRYDEPVESHNSGRRTHIIRTSDTHRFASAFALPGQHTSAPPALAFG